MYDGSFHYILLYHIYLIIEDNDHTVFGEVIEGMEYVDKILRGEPPEYPDKIISMKVSND